MTKHTQGERLKLEKIERRLSEIPITERKGALCLRVHMATVTVGKKEKWNISSSGSCIIFEKEGEGLKDYSLYLGDILEKLLDLRQAIAKAEGGNNAKEK